ncbi:MAG: phage holin family protein [Actinomycetota bacterium]
MLSGDQYKGFLDFRSNRPDQDPGFGLLYLVLTPLFAGVGFVAWVGWNWLALTLTIVTFLLVAGLLVWLSRRRYERERVPDPEWR